MTDIRDMAWCEKCDRMVPVQGGRRFHLARLAIALLLLPFTLFMSVFLVKKFEPYKCARCGSQLGFRTGPKTMPGATYFKSPVTDVLGGAFIGFVIAVIVIAAAGLSPPFSWPVLYGSVAVLVVLVLMGDHMAQVEARQKLVKKLEARRLEVKKKAVGEEPAANG
jgi:hypothetical protein